MTARKELKLPVISRRDLFRVAGAAGAAALLPAETLIAESAAQENLVGTPNQMEAVMAGMQKRAPKFRD